LGNINGERERERVNFHSFPSDNQKRITSLTHCSNFCEIPPAEFSHKNYETFSNQASLALNNFQEKKFRTFEKLLKCILTSYLKKHTHTHTTLQKF